MNQAALQELSAGEIAEIDMRAMANVILDRTVTLSTDVNQQIIKPISEWLDDPDFLKKYEVVLEDRIDWAAYKRNQRKWTRQQRLIAAERLRLYWQEIRKKRYFKSDIAKLLSNRSRPNECDEDPRSGANHLTAILSPFSPKEQARLETMRQFDHSRTLAPSNLLPWKAIILSEIDAEKDFTELPCYIPENPSLDTVAKLQYLLQLETDGLILTTQEEPFGRIVMAPQMSDPIPLGPSFTIIDSDGTIYRFNWKTLSDAQKNKVIADIKAGRILARCS